MEQPVPHLTARKFAMEGLRRLPRSPCFGLYLIEHGAGTVDVDGASHAFKAPALLCLSPYQRTAFSGTKSTSGWVLHFHARFFCIEAHHHAVGCNGVLFNDVYEVPLVRLTREVTAEIGGLMRSIATELQQDDVAHLELLVSTLKIVLIKAARLKLRQEGPAGLIATKRPDTLRQLRELLELHYQTEHRPSEYARLLGMSSKNLAQLVRVHLHKTMAELVRDRVMKHAKWQLLHTAKSVKEIAAELGYDDEFYFSRLFKRAVGRAPVAFREYETKLRAGSSLSM